MSNPESVEIQILSARVKKQRATIRECGIFTIYSSLLFSQSEFWKGLKYVIHSLVMLILSSWIKLYSLSQRTQPHIYVHKLANVIDSSLTVC